MLEDALGDHVLQQCHNRVMNHDEPVKLQMMIDERELYTCCFSSAILCANITSMYDTMCRFFSTCQVRVVRFYVSTPAFRFLPPPPDFKCKCYIALVPAGPQPRAPDQFPARPQPQRISEDEADRMPERTSEDMPGTYGRQNVIRFAR